MKVCFILLLGGSIAWANQGYPGFAENVDARIVNSDGTREQLSKVQEFINEYTPESAEKAMRYFEGSSSSLIRETVGAYLGHYDRIKEKDKHLDRIVSLSKTWIDEGESVGLAGVAKYFSHNGKKKKESVGILLSSYELARKHRDFNAQSGILTTLGTIYRFRSKPERRKIGKLFINELQTHPSSEVRWRARLGIRSNAGKREHYTENRVRELYNRIIAGKRSDRAVRSARKGLKELGARR